jgi:hypothetical protein
MNQAGGAGEYTKMFEVPAVAPTGAPEAPKVDIPQPRAEALPPPEAGKPHSYLPLILILNALFLAAIILVLYFVLKKD